MKKFVILLAVFIFAMSGCRYKGSEVVDVKAETDQVKALIEKYVMAVEEENFEFIEHIWAESENITMIGTDLNERLTGWKQIENAYKTQFKNFEDTYVNVSDQVIRLNKSGTTAWFSLVMNYNFIFKGNAVSYSGIRFTGVVDKIEGKWLLVQGHLSIPAEAQMREVI